MPDCPDQLRIGARSEDLRERVDVDNRRAGSGELLEWEMISVKPSKKNSIASVATNDAIPM